MRRSLLGILLVLSGCTTTTRETVHSGAHAWSIANRATAPTADVIIAIDRAREVVARNIENAETPGYKAVRCTTDDGKPIVTLDMQQATLRNTQRPFDVGINGSGFFRVKTDSPLGDGIAYTRRGSFYVDNDNELVVGTNEYGTKGWKLFPPLSIPKDAVEIIIEESGKIMILQSNRTEKTEIGRLELTLFTDPSALNVLSGAVYIKSTASGDGIIVNPGENGAGGLLQGFLEQSNVHVTTERLRDDYLKEWRESVLQSRR